LFKHISALCSKKVVKVMQGFQNYESDKKSTRIFWQAHRGGGAYEAPDNTMAANKYAWKLGGIPEADIRETKDGVIISLHDETPARTTTSSDSEKYRPITSFNFDEIRRWDAGIKFSERFKGEKIPSIEEIFLEMQGHIDRMVYLDLKEIDLIKLGNLIDKYGVNSQVIFAHCLQKNCMQMKKITEGVRTMLWIGGKAEEIKEKFIFALNSEFEGLDQVQLHLNSSANCNVEWPYDLDLEFVKEALKITSAAGIDLEVLPFKFDRNSISTLLDTGIRWFATDEPSRFIECINFWRE
jgi:glycerophosphoryl diester phosphodiesterase